MTPVIAKLHPYYKDTSLEFICTDLQRLLIMCTEAVKLLTSNAVYFNSFHFSGILQMNQIIP